MPIPNLDPFTAPEDAPAVQRAYQPVASAIVAGTLTAGSLITEGEVSTELGMSRTPVREAFLLLEARGLLRLYPKKGALVTALDDGEVRDLLEARVMIESTAVRICAERGHSRELSGELELLLAEQQRAARAGDVLSFAHADHLFHARVVEESHNRVIDEVYASLGPRFERVTHRIVSRDPSRLEDFMTQHHRLAEYIATGQAPQYEDLLRHHVTALG